MMDQIDGTFLPQMDPNDVVLKGYLNKDNWYGNKQKRFFELYNKGNIQYFEIKGRIRVCKGGLKVDANTKLFYNERASPPTLSFQCAQKKRDYTLI